MPSKSKKQARLMAGVAHDPKFARKVDIPQKVGKEFNQADADTGILRGRRGKGAPKRKRARGPKIMSDAEFGAR